MASDQGQRTETDRGADAENERQGRAGPPPALGRDIWQTSDGRELRIAEMHRPHLGNAQALISKWLKVEKDPVKRRELKSWRSRMRRELVKREKAWRARRKQADRSKA